jgi:hypothetical protein
MTTEDDFSNDVLSSKEAYAAMYAFLMTFNSTFKSDDIEILLTGLSTGPARTLGDLGWRGKMT